MNRISRLFRCQLNQLRSHAKLTNRELAHLSCVPESLISGLQNGNRRIGEVQARRIGEALGLQSDELKAFILQAVNTCTVKVLNEVKNYPAELINLLPMQLRRAGISAESIKQLSVEESVTDFRVSLALADEREAVLRTELTFN